METIKIEITDGVQLITLNRPDSLNAFDEAMKRELLAAFKAAERDEAVRCLVITGAGRAFGSGQDLAELKGSYLSDEPIELGDTLRKAYNPLISEMRSIDKPIIAAVNGVAAGAGCSLALACDLRIASEKASFMEAFVHVGLIPDCGSTFFLPRLVGVGKAMELCFTGEKIKADQALELGIVNRVVPAEELITSAMAWAQQLAAMPTKAIGLTKRLINQAYRNDLNDQLEAEAFAQATAGKTKDHREGVLAFLDKRQAKFEGK